MNKIYLLKEFGIRDEAKFQKDFADKYSNLITDTISKVIYDSLVEGSVTHIANYFAVDGDAMNIGEKLIEAMNKELLPIEKLLIFYFVFHLPEEQNLILQLANLSLMTYISSSQEFEKYNKNMANGRDYIDGHISNIVRNYTNLDVLSIAMLQLHYLQDTMVLGEDVRMDNVALFTRALAIHSNVKNIVNRNIFFKTSLN